jgi:hypothetical protein
MRNPRIRHRLSRGKGRRAPARKGFCEKPRIDPLLTRIFKKIGIPEPEPIRPDPFQIEALEKIGRYDVVVSAPTGSGKTWIAEQAISRCLSQGMRTWYASPLKALSNAIYEGFCRQFGDHACGILTGDRKENPGAPVIVGTTEILRNQLYDAMHQGVSVETDLVILDEAHYLGDPTGGWFGKKCSFIFLRESGSCFFRPPFPMQKKSRPGWRKTGKQRTGLYVPAQDPCLLKCFFSFPMDCCLLYPGKKGLFRRVKKFLDHAGKESKG